MHPERLQPVAPAACRVGDPDVNGKCQEMASERTVDCCHTCRDPLSSTVLRARSGATDSGGCRPLARWGGKICVVNLRTSVIGTNYLGACHAVGMAEFGHETIGVDIDAGRIKRLSAGEATVFEPGLEGLLTEHTTSGRLCFTSDYAEIADWADVHFLCVGTPSLPDGAADLRQVMATASSLAPLLTRPTVVVGKSTVPVGTAAHLQEFFRENSPAGGGVEVAWMPEFLREGHGVADTLHPDRVVFGVQSEATLDLLRRCFARPLADSSAEVVCDLATAELTKAAANAFLATKISFINAMSSMCEVAGGDVAVLADALGLDARIGRQFLDAGLGFGGGCLPKDIQALSARAGQLGVQSLVDLIAQVEAINDGQRDAGVELATRMLGGQVAGCAVAVLGLAFKSGTDDVRNSPSLDVAQRLGDLGARVTVYDPQATVNDPRLAQASSVEEAVDQADLVLHLTDWPEFRELDPVVLATHVAQRLVLDARLKLDPRRWAAAGWEIRQLGRSSAVG